MNFETYHKAKTFLRRQQVQLISATAGHFYFVVGPNKYDIFRSPREGWSCSAAKPTKEVVGGKEVAVKKGCVLFGRGLDCSHIRACQMWLQKRGIKWN